jgi:hypothetical protein
MDYKALYLKKTELFITLQVGQFFAIYIVSVNGNLDALRRWK